MGQKSLSHIGSSVWNKSPVSMKRSTSLNPFKHDVKNINYKNYGCNIIIFIIIITNTDTNFIIFIVTIIIIITILMLLSHYYCYRYCYYHYYHCLCNYIFFPQVVLMNFICLLYLEATMKIRIFPFCVIAIILFFPFH